MNVTNSTFTNIFLRADSIIQLEKRESKKENLLGYSKTSPFFPTLFLQ